MTKKPKPPPDDPEESARFMQLAETIGLEKPGSAFRRAVKKLFAKKQSRRRSGE
ncbi:MAG: hypothetical protein BroJett026_20420 [Betaproteobacteria bacterium]|nr:MAG: hypothetical protein BroJett026_20420 [Betaproteobacteria bacterium]